MTKLHTTTKIYYFKYYSSKINSNSNAAVDLEKVAKGANASVDFDVAYNRGR